MILVVPIIETLAADLAVYLIEKGAKRAMDANANEVVHKVQALVSSHFSNDYMAAFKHYDLDSNSKLGPKDLWVLLADAGVGNVFTRKAWVNGILSQLDKDKDGTISVPELMIALAESFAFAPAK